jgi:WD40 repeat protein
LIKIWDGESADYRFLIPGAHWDLAFTSDGKQVASVDEACAVKLWDASQAQGSLVHTAKENLYHARHSATGGGSSMTKGQSSMPPPAPSCGPFLPRKETGFDAKIKLWDTESGLEVLTLAGHASWIWEIWFSPDGQRPLSCSRDTTVRIWDASPLGPEAFGSH